MKTPDALSIQTLLTQGAQQLAGGDSPMLDARLLLAHVLGCDQTFLHTWPEKQVSSEQHNRFAQLVTQRQAGQPVAYLLGYRDFWSLRLTVNPHTLIPRPETETLVEVALQLELPQTAKVLDLGTGSGAIALALAAERPKWQISGVDRVAQAIALAQQNARHHQLQRVNFYQSHWFSAVPNLPFDLIVSNPPYVEKNSPYLQQGDVRFEPDSALTAGKSGLDDIQHIISEAIPNLAPGGWLVLEHGYQQAESVQALMMQMSLKKIQTHVDLNQCPRVTLGCFCD